MLTYTVGGATLEVDPDQGNALLSLPVTWDGTYERDAAQALLILQGHGMPQEAPYEVVEGPDAERWVLAWDPYISDVWEPARTSQLEADAFEPLVSSDLRNEIDGCDIRRFESRANAD